MAAFQPKLPSAPASLAALQEAPAAEEAEDCRTAGGRLGVRWGARSGSTAGLD